MSIFKGFSLTVGIASTLITLLPLPTLAQARADWRFFNSVDGTARKPRLDHYIDIRSVKKSGDVYSFQTMTASADGDKTFSNIRINCRQNYIDYVNSVRQSPNGQRLDVSDVTNIFDGVADYTVQPYCRLFAGGNLQNMPTSWTPQSRSSSSSSGSGRCNSPDDLDARGRRCGGRASSVRPGGRP